MAGHAVLVSRMADADAYSAEILADVCDHAAGAVVARCAAALLHLHLHRGEVEFVVKGGNILRRQFVEIERGAHAAAAFVHKGAGLEQQDALRSDAAFLDPALEFLRRSGEVVKVGDDVGGHEADIVRSEEQTSELQSLMRISYAVFCLKKKMQNINQIF